MNPRLDEVPHPPLAESGGVVLRLGTLAAIGLALGTLGPDPPQSFAANSDLRSQV
jgi:hypothetical protein